MKGKGVCSLSMPGGGGKTFCRCKNVIIGMCMRNPALKLPFSHSLLVSEPSSWKKMILRCTTLALK